MDDFDEFDEGFSEDDFSEDEVEYCDVCGSELDEEDKAIHLCKNCQVMTMG